MTTLPLAFDRASNREYDADGRLRVRDSVITAAVISPYRGDEIPEAARLGLDPDRIYYLLRDPDELRKAIKTFDGVPLLDRHRPATAYDHPADITVGAVWNPKFDGERLTADLVIWPEFASRAVEEGSRRDLSAGYGFRALMQPGTHRGEHFDGRMVDIVGNHVALVVEGRTPAAMVADEAPFYGRSTKVKYRNTFRAVFLAADAAVRRRRARDEEPSEAELVDEPASPDDLVDIVKEWMMDMAPEESERFIDELIRLRDEYGATAGMDRRRARDRAVGPWERSDPPPFERADDRRSVAGDLPSDRRRHAHDAALLRNVRPASERFKNLGRSTSMGGPDRLTA